MELRRVESMQRIPSEFTAIKKLQDCFMRDLECQAYDTETTFALALGFAEAVANAFMHGNERNSAKRITVTYRLDHGHAELEVRDEGGGFDPSRLPHATSEDGLGRPSGRGVLLMRSLFDEVRFLHGGRCVRLVKKVQPAKACAA